MFYIDPKLIIDIFFSLSYFPPHLAFSQNILRYPIMNNFYLSFFTRSIFILFIKKIIRQLPVSKIEDKKM